MEITREIAIKVRDVVDAGLSHGVGQPVPGQMCVEASVCYALDLPHGDDPGCVSPALRQLKITLNDRSWSSPQARATGLRRLALAQLGSAGALDDREFVRRVAEMTIRTVVPLALREAARVVPVSHKTPLLDAAERCEREGTREAADAAANAAYAANANAYAYVAVVYAAADAAADAACAAANVYAAAYAAANAAYAAADARARDRVLSDYAESVVQILIAMHAPGCQWLDLAPVVPS